ncbi:hypothetical protein LVD15_01830 [Fulvivirga maritima]|uniref:hypothetical protein n=1 Tax=Fulvivirga maritima TaxID=2904247 RepID=UPI001F31A031|nr:hypothetical protein [Fulvivirga maritima]UII27191.1 hypothetical protein LVD15_01830 [Fulvivirga maritima]
MNKHHLLPIIFGSLLVLMILFEKLLWRTFWIMQPVPILIVAVGCFFILLNSLIYKKRKNAIIILASGLIAVLIYLPRTELLKSKPVIKASLIDDLSALRLTLRENHSFELVPETWMGTFEEFTGKYQIDGKRIIFLDQPYDNDFIPDTVYIYKEKILLNNNLNEPDTSFSNFFDIQLNLLEKPDNK